MKKVKVLTLALTLGLLVSLTGCAALERATDAHAQADRATYDAVAPEYSEMSKEAYKKKADGTYSKWFTDSQSKRRLRTVETWKKNVEATEKEAKGNKEE